MKYLVTIFLSLFIVCKPVAFAQFTSAPVVASQETIVKDGATFYVHKVEQNQTIFSICKTYGIEIATLLADNPEVQKGLKAGDTIYIRKASAAQQKYVKHIVRWYESLTSIANKYNVSEEIIMKYNSLKSNRLEVRQMIKIPVGANYAPNKEDNEEIITVRQEVPHNKIDSVAKKVLTKEEPKIDSNAIKNQLPLYRQPSSKTFDVSLILPFESKNPEPDGNNNYLDFYQGFLLALEDLKEEGMSLNLKVFDMANYSNGSMLTQTGKLDGSDLIIGPIFLNEVEPVLAYASEKGIPLVSPMDPKTEKLLEGHPKFFQVSTNQYIQQYELFKNIPVNETVTLIYESDNPEAGLVNMTKEILNSRGIHFSVVAYNVKSGRTVSSQIANKLSRNSMNNVAVVSNSEAFVSDALRNLSLLSTRSNYQITVYGMPRWRNFEIVDINYFHSLNLHLSLQYHINYADESVRSFLSRYRALYGTEPSPYAFQAYDVASFFLDALYRFGPDFTDNIEGYTKELLQNDLKFTRKGKNSGFINSTARQVIYNPDYSIEISRLNR